MFNYARHFVLLGLSSCLLAAAGSHGLGGIGARFALSGALHATALALSIVGGARLSPGRRLSFIAGAAILALATARLGIFGLHALRVPGGAAGPFGEPFGEPFGVLAACAGFGALAYGGLIRAVLAGPAGCARGLGMKWLIATSLGCAAATSASFAASRALHATGILWVVAPWWFAFSAGLCSAAHAESQYAHLASKSIR